MDWEADGRKVLNPKVAVESIGMSVDDDVGALACVVVTDPVCTGDSVHRSPAVAVVQSAVLDESRRQGERAASQRVGTAKSR